MYKISKTQVIYFYLFNFKIHFNGKFLNLEICLSFRNNTHVS